MNQMQQMLMQAQKMQRELGKAHEELASKEFKVAKAGMVEITIKGDKSVSSIKIDKDAIDPDNVEMLEESIVLAINEAMEQIQKASDEIDQKITGKANFPF